jgi:hypothetical protein
MASEGLKNPIWNRGQISLRRMDWFCWNVTRLFWHYKEKATSYMSEAAYGRIYVCDCIEYNRWPEKIQAN